MTVVVEIDASAGTVTSVLKTLFKAGLTRAIIWTMKKELMNILVCPVCKGKLELTVDKETDTEIVSGSLYCGKCSVRYPVTGAIPNLLPPEKATQSGR
jgi:uncharacterized protein YbaR (Trm112 family)